MSARPAATPREQTGQVNLITRFHHRVGGDRMFQQSLARLWCEFGAEIAKEFHDHRLGSPENIFGNWVDGWCQVIARQTEDEATPF